MLVEFKYAHNLNDESFFALVPSVYREQQVRKMKVLQRHGVEGCKDTVFLRPANISEAPADYVLTLQDDGIESISILFKWDREENTAYFFRILPDRYCPF